MLEIALHGLSLSLARAISSDWESYILYGDVIVAIVNTDLRMVAGHLTQVTAAGEAVYALELETDAERVLAQKRNFPVMKILNTNRWCIWMDSFTTITIVTEFKRNFFPDLS